MKTLVFPDLHLRHHVVDPIVDMEKPQRVVLLGDYFDDFDDKAGMHAATAAWVKSRLFSYDFLIGNHDIHYMSNDHRLQCSGYDDYKFKEINSVLKAEDWNQMKFHTWVGSYLLTHAGIHPHYMPLSGSLKKSFKPWMQRQEEDAFIKLKAGMDHWFWAAGKARYGRAPVGGILWCDFNDEFKPVRQLHQLVGHTPGRHLIWAKQAGSANLCLDTDTHHYAVFTKGITHPQVKPIIT